MGEKVKWQGFCQLPHTSSCHGWANSDFAHHGAINASSELYPLEPVGFPFAISAISENPATTATKTTHTERDIYIYISCMIGSGLLILHHLQHYHKWVGKMLSPNSDFSLFSNIIFEHIEHTHETSTCKGSHILLVQCDLIFNDTSKYSIHFNTIVQDRHTPWWTKTSQNLFFHTITKPQRE